LSDYRRLIAAHPDPGDVHLLIGPWDHHGSSGPADRAVCHQLVDTQTLRWDTYQRFFDHYLLGLDNGLGADGSVCVFTLGRNSWQHLPAWPPPDMTQTPVYLHAGDTLSFEPPQDAEPPDQFSYDPSDPVPETVGRCCWELCTALEDRRWLDGRADILRYVSDPLERDVELAGPIVAELYAPTSAVDTDFTATLCDVFADGTVNTIQDGIVRARYRDGCSAPSLVEPGRIYPYFIELSETSYLVPRGHRLRVDVSSSNFDRYDRNLNDGAPAGRSEKAIVAIQAIHHSAEAASRVLLPTRVPRPAADESRRQLIAQIATGRHPSP
jgi:putative CocE/NonD family hydrolase